jgi:hypothetical protein
VSTPRTRQAVRSIAVGTVLVALAACGSTGGQGPPQGQGSATSTTPATSPGSPSPTPSPSSSPATFPIVVTRTGGIAGFHDRIVLHADGRLEVTSRGRQSTCQVKPEVLKEILRAVGGVPWGRLATTDGRPRHPDDMVLLVTSAASAGPARLTDPRLGALQQPLSDLVVDTSGPNPAHELCSAV